MPTNASPKTLAQAVAVLGTRPWTVRLNPHQIKDLTSDYASYLEYHRGVSHLRKQLEAGGPISDSAQRRLLRSGPNAEKSLKRSLATGFDTIHGNEDLFLGSAGAAGAIRDHIDELRVFSDPGHFSEDGRGAITRTGVTLGEYSRYYDVLFGQKNGPALQACLAGLGDDVKDVVKKTHHWVHGSRFPESEAELRKHGIITIHGGDSPTPYIIGAAAIVVGVAIIVGTGGLGAGVVAGTVAIATGAASTGTMIGASIALAGATLIATEAYQDITGTQDRYWKYLATYRPNLEP